MGGEWRLTTGYIRNLADTQPASPLPPLQLHGPRILIRDIARHDLDEMDAWQSFDDPLAALWNLPRSTPVARDIWFALYGADTSRLWYAVDRAADGQFIGTISLREIMERKQARLGISFGADRVDQGYGSEALRTFLPYFFDDMGFQVMVLDVAATNRRAIHVYDRLGFQHVDQQYRDVPDNCDLSFLDSEPYRQFKPYFRRRFLRWQLVFYEMSLDRPTWLAQQSK